MKLTKEEKELLNRLAAGTAFVPLAMSASLFSMGLVELKTDLQNSAGTATRISPKGAEYLKKYSVKLEKGLEVPPLPKKAGRPPKYPFKTMLAGDSFLVNACPTMPTPYDSLKSTVSIANKKFKPKNFEIRRDGIAARIFRTK